MPQHCSSRNHRNSKRVARGRNASNNRSRRSRVMNSLRRMRNALTRRGRSRRYNIVPEPEPEPKSNHTNGRYFRFNNKYARKGKFNYNTMNQYRYKRPLSRKSLQPFQTNLSKSALAKRRKTHRLTEPPQYVLDRIRASPSPRMWGY